MSDKPADALHAPREEWAKLEAAVRALPEEEKFFLSYEYRAWIDDSDKKCGCLLGQIVRLNPEMEAKYREDRVTGDHTDIVSAFLHVSRPVVWAAERYNDRFYPNQNDAETAERRYQFTLARLTALANGTEEVDIDPPQVTS